MSQATISRFSSLDIWWKCIGYRMRKLSVFLEQMLAAVRVLPIDSLSSLLSVIPSLLTHTSAEALPVTWAYLDTQLGAATLGLGRLTLFGCPTVEAVTSLYP